MRQINGQLSIFDFLGGTDNEVSVPVKIKKETRTVNAAETFEAKPSEEPQIIESTEPSPEPERINFHQEIIPETKLTGSYKRNVLAIRCLKKLQSEHRLADSEEQKILSAYCGWGGLSQVFDERTSENATKREELKSLLTKEEYDSARKSTLTAFYTPDFIIRFIWKALRKMGIKGGNILEPSCGTGRFIGNAPENADFRFYATELDTISGEISKQLYQKEKIQVTGFEKTSYPDNFFSAAIGNVPFGNFQIADSRYDKYHFLIHDYFFAKSLDLVQPGGIIAFITSSGTMDKENSSFRCYLAERADLVRAIRLPNTAFKSAGTEVVSDILFFQKRDIQKGDVRDVPWVSLGQIGEYRINNAFIQNGIPVHICGNLKMISGPYGDKQTVTGGESLKEELDMELNDLPENIIHVTDVAEEEKASIPADPDCRNYAYSIVDGKLYYRENAVMMPVECNVAKETRIKKMVEIRTILDKLLAMELSNEADHFILDQQKLLNKRYEEFVNEYGYISSLTNRRAMQDDSSYHLINALEILDDDGNVIGKSDVFTKRTIRKAETVKHVDSATDAFSLSMGKYGKVNMSYMVELTGKEQKELLQSLKGQVFEDPVTKELLAADEYLSGNIREKLKTAKEFSETDQKYTVNVEYLEKVLPKDLDATEIEVRLGSTWIDPKYIDEFIQMLLDPPYWTKIKTEYSKATGAWAITGNRHYLDNDSKSTMDYGTKDAPALRLIEDALNLRDTKIYDRIEGDDGKTKSVINKEKTMLAQQKQQVLKDKFKDWIFQDYERRQNLTRKYNDTFNSFRPREFDGSYLKFDTMNPDIKLRPHQKDAVARILMSHANSLIAYCVGAGKTWAMTAGAMESKRLGFCHKSLFVVPNHLTEQWGSDFLKLYPMANILIAKKRDFEPARRKRFVSQIAMGDYDAVIIGHSQFERIPLSKERQNMMLEEEMTKIVAAIEEEQVNSGSRSFSVKQLERCKAQVQAKIDRLSDIKQDDVVTFESLGVDRLFVDEAHYYKNLYLFTKMNNVSGVSQTDAKKSTDLFLKTQYLDSIGGHVIFATGTPVSNTMAELFTMQRYLQYDHLKALGLDFFDAWAAQFGETVTSIELAPEGTGYRAKTRFSRFYNLPELMSIFREVADIRTQDQMNLQLPETKYVNVQLEASDYQKDYVQSLSERADKIHNGGVDATEDNMLKVTSDGRKCALDQRLVAAEGEFVPDDPDSKVNACCKNVYKLWKMTEKDKSTQLVFCDLSTPRGDNKFNVYDDAREKLVNMGIPREEIRFIHEAKTEVQKKELFGKVRSGEVRILFGSTSKLGCGTNIQDRLIALHHLDAPWKPADLEQQEGRIIRQGNLNCRVLVFRYVTKATFDAYMWQTLENKQRFISQIMTSHSAVRSCDDVDEASLSYAEVKSLCTGDPRIKEKMQLDVEVAKLKVLQANFRSEKYRLESDIASRLPADIEKKSEAIQCLEMDKGDADHLQAKPFSMIVSGVKYNDQKEAGRAIAAVVKSMQSKPGKKVIAHFGPFDLSYEYDNWGSGRTIFIHNRMTYSVSMAVGYEDTIKRILHTIGNISEHICRVSELLKRSEEQLAKAKEDVRKGFPQEQELAEKLARLNELNAALNLDKEDFSASTVA